MRSFKDAGSIGSRLTAAITISTSMLVTSAAAQSPPPTPPTCLEGDLDGNGIVDEVDLERLRRNLGRTCTPTIRSVTPATGPTGGGTTVILEGDFLGQATAARIGGTPVAGLIAQSPSRLAVILPPGAEGPQDVVVTTPSGEVSLVGGFAYSTQELGWGEVLEFEPDPAVVVDPAIRSAIIATGLPWRVRDHASGARLVLIPPGAFVMGDAGAASFPNERPTRQVTISKPFYLGANELTQSRWVAVMGTNPSAFADREDAMMRPVEQVSVPDVQAFLAKTGLRLPTEAEWEYACRGGTTGPLYGELSEIAWYWPMCRRETHEVGGKRANAFGLHDMIGNVSEWVADWHAPYPPGDVVDPGGPAQGTEVVTRGGSWYFATLCSATRRYPLAPTERHFHVGFRVARDP
ncbi:MAG: hypothetical protein FJ257_10885 [Phycisphaerae bacterium]|nr:hypothetical protein [Phycisphaerae bacterium]